MPSSRRPEKEALTIGDVKLEDVTAANGGYDIGTVSTSAFEHSKDGVTLNLSPFVIHDMTVPAEGATGPLGALMMYKSAELANMTVKVADKTAFSMDGLAIKITPPADGKAMEFTGTTEKFNADLTLVDDPEVQGSHRRARLPEHLRQFRNGRHLAALATASWNCRNTTSPSRMPARSA